MAASPAFSVWRRLFIRRMAPRNPDHRWRLSLEQLEARETPSASPGTVATIAGGPLPAVPSPCAVAVDASGNLFVVDGANRVREVHAGAGVVTTVAGTGVAGYNGDNIPASSAELDDPSGVAVDSAGNLFIAEDLDNRIREVNHVTGLITTVAGTGSQWTTGSTLTAAGAQISPEGVASLLVNVLRNGFPTNYNGDNIPATRAELCAPQGLAVDSAGHLFIADWLNNRVREVNLTTGIITTVAGNGVEGYNGDGLPATSAELDGPKDVSVDAFGNLFIADQGNDRVREVNAATGLITTLVGPGVNQGGPYKVALDAGGDLFIAYQDSNCVSQWNAQTGQVTTIAGAGGAGYNGDNIFGSVAELNQPEGLAVDRAGNLFIADNGNDSIREVNVSTGIISTTPGTGRNSYQLVNVPATTARLFQPSGVAVDASGNLFVADDMVNVIQDVNHTTGMLTTVAGGGAADPYAANNNIPASSATLVSPTGVAVDAAGDVYINDLGTNRIQEVNHTTGMLTTVAGGGLLFGYNGDNIPATSAELDSPAAVAVDAAGNVYFTDLGNDRIREVNAGTGIITTIAGNGIAGYNGDNIPATSAELNEPGALAVDAAGNLFFTDWDNNRVREVNHATGLITTVAGNGKAGFAGDNGLAVNASLDGPAAVVVDASGNLFIADYGNNRVREVNPVTRVITTVAGVGVPGDNGDNLPATATELYHPDALAVDSAGNLFIEDAGNKRILELAAVRAPDHLVVNAGSMQMAGKAVSFTVQTFDASNHRDTSFSGKVHFTSSDAHATLPADATLVNGISTFSAVLRTTGNATLAASSPLTPTGNVSATVHVTAAAVSQFLISVPAASAGSTVVALATAEDAFGNVATNFTGTVGFASSDAKAVLPPAYHFQAADAGVHSFNVVLHTAGTQTVTVKDTHSPGVKASISVPVLAGPAVRLSVANSNSAATAGAAMTWTVTAQDAFGNTASRYQGVVQLSSSDSKAVLPGTLTFGKSDNGIKQFTVVFHTAGTQSVSVSDKTAHLSASLSAIVQAGAASKLLLTGSKAPKAGTAAVYTLTAMDAFGNVATGYRGTVRWQSTDGKASLPSAYTFSATDKGSHSFSITFVGKKSQTLSAADTVNGTISGSESGIVVM